MVTPLQTRVYEFVCRYIKEHRYSPSLEEIATGIGISPRSVSLISRAIHALVEAGQLTFYKKGYRNIRIAKPGAMPVLGRIGASSASLPPLANVTFDVSRLLHNEQHFAYEVASHTLQEEGFFPGDFVICKRVVQAAEGDKVLALINQRAATLKRISYQLPGRITLLPLTTQQKPRAYFPEQVQVEGVYVGLFRLHREE